MSNKLVENLLSHSGYLNSQNNGYGSNNFLDLTVGFENGYFCGLFSNRINHCSLLRLLN